MYPCSTPHICGVKNHRSPNACKGQLSSTSSQNARSLNAGLLSPTSSQGEAAPKKRISVSSAGGFDAYYAMEIDNYPKDYQEEDGPYVPAGAFAQRFFDESKMEQKDFDYLRLEQPRELALSYKNSEGEDRRADIRTEKDQLYVNVIDPVSNKSVIDNEVSVTISNSDDLQTWFEEIDAEKFSMYE